MTFAGKYNGDDEDLEADGEADEDVEVDRFGGLVSEEFFTPNDTRLREGCLAFAFSFHHACLPTGQLWLANITSCLCSGQA